VYRGKLRYVFRLLKLYSNITNSLRTVDKFVPMLFPPLQHESPLPSSDDITLKHNKRVTSFSVSRSIDTLNITIYVCTHNRDRLLRREGGGGLSTTVLLTLTTLPTAKTLSSSFSNSLSIRVLRLVTAIVALKNGLYKILPFCMAIQPFRPWPLFQFLNHIHGR
jgi:hypothetical protein